MPLRPESPTTHLWMFPISASVHHGSLGHRPRQLTVRGSPWSSKDFYIREKLGSGRFGRVYTAVYRGRDTTSTRGIWKKNCKQNHSESTLRQGKEVALKRFSKDTLLNAKRSGERSFDLLMSEINIHSHLQHPNILPFFGYFGDARHIYMVLQHAPGKHVDVCELEFLSKKERLVRAQRILLQVCQAVAYLHRLQVAHRDIKPENILVMSPNYEAVKLCDFGWATWWKPGVGHSTFCGTPEFIAPDLLRTKLMYSPEFVDPWSLGVLTMELVQTITPFSVLPSLSSENFTYDKRDTFELIRSFKGNPVVDPKAGPDYRDFVSRLLQVEPTARMTAGEAVNHAFLRPVRRNRSALSEIQVPTVAQRCQLFEQTATRIII